MGGWKSPIMLAKVKPPSSERKLSMKSDAEGRKINKIAKRKKGTRPSHVQVRRGRRGGFCTVVAIGSLPGMNLWQAPALAAPARDERHITKLLGFGHIGADNRIPVGDDGFLALHQLLIGREDGAANVGQLVEQLLRHDVARAQVGLADRVAVALHPDNLAFVRVEEFHPQLG